MIGNKRDALLLSGKKLKPYLGPIATGVNFPNTQNTTAAMAAMTRKGHYARANVNNNMQLMYSNGWVDTVSNNALGVEKGGGNSIDVKAWIEYPLTVYTQVTFAGSTTGTIANAADMLSDPCAVVIPKGALFYTYTRVVGNSGNDFPYFSTSQAGNPLFYTGAGNLGEGCLMATSGVPTTPGVIVDNFSGRQGFYPSAILGWTSEPTYGIIGDSRTSGVFDVADVSTDLGNLARSIGPTRGYVNCSVAGDRLSSFLKSSALRQHLLSYCTIVVDELGYNAFNQQGANNVTSVQAYKKRLAYLFNGKKYARTTLAPWTTSTDNWATTVNQTVNAATNASQIAYNDWAKAAGDGVVCLDIGAPVESSVDSGLWLPSATQNTHEGIHESPAGLLIIAASGNVNPATLDVMPKISVPPLNIDMSLIVGTAASYTAAEFGNGLNGGYGYVFGITPGAPPFAFECWAKVAAPLAGAVIGCGPLQVFSLVTSGFLSITDGAGTQHASTTNICDGVFHHIAVTIDASANVVAYVDGVSILTFTVASLTSARWLNEKYPLMIRSKATNGVATSNSTWTNGIIDEVAIWNSLKYTTGFTPPVAPYVGTEANLLGVWHLDNSLAGIPGPAF